jgi:hypothetical protein
MFGGLGIQGLGLTRIQRNGYAPTSLGSLLIAWWTADRTDLITLSSTKVTSWKDAVAGYDLVQATDGARPVYSATSFNGAPGVTFDGTDDYLSLESVPLPTGADPCEIWMLIQQDTLAADTSGKQIFAYGGNAGASRRSLTRSVVTGVNRARSNTGTGGATVDVTDTAVDFSGRKVLRAVFSATETTLTIDTTTTGPTAAVPATGTTRVRFGSSTNDTATGFWNGKMRDIIVTSPLSAAQAAALKTYLDSRA